MTSDEFMLVLDAICDAIQTLDMQEGADPMDSPITAKLFEASRLVAQSTFGEKKEDQLVEGFRILLRKYPTVAPYLLPYLWA